MSESNNQPEKPTSFIEYDPLPSGTTETPFLTHITHGQRKNSRIFHTKENNLYFEYSIRHCLKFVFIMEIKTAGSANPISGSPLKILMSS